MMMNYCLPYSSCDVSLENLVLDQLTIPLLIFFLILITCLLDVVLILREIMSWSLLGVKGLLRELNLLITRQEISPFNIYTIYRKVTRSKKNINKEILIDLTSNP